MLPSVQLCSTGQVIVRAKEEEPTSLRDTINIMGLAFCITDHAIGILCARRWLSSCMEYVQANEVTELLANLLANVREVAGSRACECHEVHVMGVSQIVDLLTESRQEIVVASTKVAYLAVFLGQLAVAIVLW